MRNRDLAADHVRRAIARLRTLDVLFDAESWADVVREAQEVVELALKGLLRELGTTPGLLSPDARVVIETPSELFRIEGELANMHLEAVMRREYGSTALLILGPLTAAPP